MNIKLSSIAAFAVLFTACNKIDLSPKADELQQAKVDQFSLSVGKSKVDGSSLCY